MKLTPEEYATLVEQAPILIWRSDLSMGCDYRKRVRDDKGFWQRVESYVTGVTHKEITTGICPTCLARQFPER